MQQQRRRLQGSVAYLEILCSNGTDKGGNMSPQRGTGAESRWGGVWAKKAPKS